MDIKISKQLLKFLLVLTSLVLYSCGPNYRKVYIPPPYENGGICLNDCLFFKHQALRDCEQNYNICYNHAQNYYLTSRVTDSLTNMLIAPQPSFASDNHRIWNENRTEHHYRHAGDHCTSSLNQCKLDVQRDYDICYTNCGGQIFLDRVD